MSAPLLQVQDLCVDFTTRQGPLRALDGVSLSIDAGEILGLVGESGAGKSLTGAALIGLMEPSARITRGEIVFEGQRIDQATPAQWRQIRGRRIGAVFQDPLTSLNPLYSIGQQLQETLQAHLPLSTEAARRRAIELLHETGIAAAEQRLHQYPHQLSGGLRQRVVIALALAARPSLVIADEPTTALDVSIQAQILALLRRLCREQGTAVLLVTHDMGVIAETCDRVAVMYAGRIVEIGPVQSVIHHGAHPYTRGLMAAIPSLSGERERLMQIPGAMPRLGAMPAGCAFHPRCLRADTRCGTDRPELQPVRDTRAACWWPEAAGGGAAEALR